MKDLEDIFKILENINDNLVSLKESENKINSELNEIKLNIKKLENEEIEIKKMLREIMLKEKMKYW